MFPLSDAVADRGDLELLAVSLLWGMAVIPQGSAALLPGFIEPQRKLKLLPQVPSRSIGVH